jgi:tRNA nucleotidyltransferase (CCA-adding enzyme)
LDKVAEVCNRVRERVVPPSKLRVFVESKAEEIRQAVEQGCEKSGLRAEVRLDGSVAKDTWIRDYVDADIFMRVSPELSKQQLRELCLPIAKKALEPHEVVERFAEHPYVESNVKFAAGYLRVNVVPCYSVEKGNWLSATDRTPFHTDYIRTHLSNEERDEVRLLKAFLRGVGSYGADIKTGGFSGMLCETLIIAYGNFSDVVQDFRQWREDRFIDVEKYYAEREDEVHRIFREALVVVDPVDKGRNLGSAVRPGQLWNFVAASRQFLQKPSQSFFSERKAKPLKPSEYRSILRRHGSAILCLAIGQIDAVVDILWSQLYRTQRALVQFLENNDFRVIRSAAWSDEHKLNVLLFELDSDELPIARKHEGPPVSKMNESLAFLSKHKDREDTLYGPWIANDRWTVEKKRVNVTASALLEAALRTGGVQIGVASLLQDAFRKKLNVLKDGDLARLISANEEFAKFMRTYLSGRPVWFD